jgi:tetratricopeptide (TPR) repeat protein
VACVVAVKAELPSWAQEAIALSPLEGALFRIMGLPDGTVTHLRPAWESRNHLAQLIEKTPQDAGLYSLRALQEERLADFPAAEADWKQAAMSSHDKVTALGELADFYHRRVEPEQEVSTLLQLGALPAQGAERYQLPAQQPQWNGLRRALDVCNESLLPAARDQQVYNAWIRRYPKESAPYQAYLDWTVAHHNRSVAEGVAARLKAAFPSEIQLAVSTDADLARVENGASGALAVYSRNFSPLWPEGLRTKYFQELGEAHQLRTFLGDAQSKVAADPASLDPALRVFFYYEQQGRKDVADQTLLTLIAARAAHSATWTADELKTVSALLLRVADYDESARLSYALYELPSASATDKEAGLSSTVSMLLDVPEQPLNFGNRDLSLYRNVARMDRHPGFLNGILSLALNSTSPDYQYQNASQTAVAYFHRASASRLLDLLNQQFPQAPQTPTLQAKLYAAYAVYGQQDAIVHFVPAWLNRNRNAPDYVATSLLLADAYESKRNTPAELAIYDRLLADLATRSGHMPIGPEGVIEVTQDTPSAAAANNARSPGYSRVLDRYISRLVQLNRNMQAVALFRREIDHNPDDPGIYERFALFLEQNSLDNDLKQTYTDALNHFKDLSWANKLARFYLRQRQTDAYEQLAQQITDTFKGSELAGFLLNVRPTSPVLFRQVNLYAHKRFPHNLTFTKNLLAAYREKTTRDDAAYTALLRENWFYDTDLRNSYFEYLSSTGKLATELAGLADVDRSVKDSNLAALEFRAAGEAWLTHYETAAPVFVRLAALTPGDQASTGRAITIERSLAATQSGTFDSAIRLAQQDAANNPGNREAITRIGEIFADRELYSQAQPWWNRVASVRPGVSDGYLDSATVFWDYLQFNDALRIISDARRRLGDPALFSYEAGAIYENAGDTTRAVDSYIGGALHGSEEAKARLLQLARRSATAQIVDSQTARLTNSFNSDAFQLRLALLEKLNRRSEIQSMLESLLPKADSTSAVEEISSAATRLGFDEIAAGSLRRIVAITTDPIEKIQARIDLARFYENHNDAASAEREFSSLLKQEPNRLGVIRAAVDFYWRQKQSQTAVATLESASGRAQPPYRDQLLREAAEKAANSNQYEDARRLLDQLLAADPFNGDMLAEKAATYAHQNDNRGLIDFYASELTALQNALLPSQEKTMRIAALRRGYILALTTAGQFRDALEQYQLILNAYTDDGSLAAEVARYAGEHQLTSALIGYYGKATADSPRDYRWPLVLARLYASLRQYPEAISAYNKAVVVRPDRADLFLAKADLETRLLRFDDAIQTYGKLYELSFHDAQYLGRQAELYARLGNTAQAVRLLRAAYIDPHPKEPGGYVNAMQSLANWRMYGEETGIFDELRPLLSTNSPWLESALILETQALTVLHRPVDAFSTISAFALKPAELRGLTRAAGKAVADYLEPEGRASLVRQIENSNPLPKGMDVLEFAQAAGFRDIEASQLLRQSRKEGSYTWQNLNQLQSSRLLFDQLGRELESIAKTQTDPNTTTQILSAAFAAYVNAEDREATLRLSDQAGSDFPRLFVDAGGDLKQRFSTLTEQNPKRANEVIQYLIANSRADSAVSAIATRGQRLSSTWINSYTALTALYILSPDAWGMQSFERIIGPQTVGEQLRQASGNSFLRGPNWFYYAARFGAYLDSLKRPDAANYLSAPLEENPAASNNYVAVGDTLVELKQPGRATRLYRDALQLSPNNAGIYDRLACVAFIDNRRSDAIAEWRRAFEMLSARVDQGPLPPEYWQTAHDLFAHVNRAHAIEDVKAAADAMLRAYARRNGLYQFGPFLSGIFDHPPDPKAALAWVIDLARIPGMESLLSMVLNSPDWVDAASKDQLCRAEIERARKAEGEAAGQATLFARRETNRQISVYANYLSEEHRWPEAWTVLQQIQPASEIASELLLTVGARTSHLNELLAGFWAKPETAPSSEQVLAASAALKKAGSDDLALQLREYEYGRELAGSAPPASAWFGMAEVRFDQKRNQEAISLIRSATLSVGAPFENLSEAVHLLEGRGSKAEALNYATELKTAEPWDNEAQLAFARLQSDSKLLDDLRRESTASYAIRVQAARCLREVSSSVGGADELSLLTHSSISPEEAAKPFYVEARLDAAAQTTDSGVRIKLYRDAIATDPELRAPRLELAASAFRAGKDVLGLAAFDSYQVQPDEELKAYVSAEQLAAEAAVRRADWARALNLYGDLLTRVQDPAQRNVFAKARDSALKEQNLRSLNESRAPVVSDDVAQPLIVRPKLASLPDGLFAGGAQ